MVRALDECDSLRLALLISAFLLQVRVAIATAQTGDACGVPLLVHATLDTGSKGFDATPTRVLPMIPYGAGVDVDGRAHAHTVLRAHGLDMRIGPNPALVRTLLLRSAGPAPGAPHEVGAGLISLESTIAMLTALSWNDLIELAVPAGSFSPIAELDGISLSRPGDLDALYRLAVDTRIQYGSNIATRRIIASVRPLSA